MQAAELPAPEIRVRAADERDRTRVDEMVAALSQRSLTRRFLGGVSPASARTEFERELRPGAGHVALVAENPAGDVLGEAYAAGIDRTAAEVSFVVRDAWQHRHVGSALRDRLFVALQDAGYRTAIAETMHENVAMRHLMLAGGYPCSEELREGGVVRLRVQIG